MIEEVVWAEARGESTEGKRAVAHVVLNRVRDPRFPNTVEGVITQRSQFVRSRGSGALWEACIAVARNPGPDPTNGALYFANYRAWPRKRFHGQIGNHYFYS